MDDNAQDPATYRYFEDFVDRTTALKLMHNMAPGENESVATLFGIEGIGKSYLLQEFFGELMKAGDFQPVKLTFTGSPGTNFFDVIVNTIAYLGQEGFEEVGEAIEEAAQSANIDPAVVATEVAAALEQAEDGAPEVPYSGQGIQIAEGAKIDQNVFSGNFAGRNLVIVNQALRKDDEKVQAALLGLISNAFFECLERIGRERRLVFLFDGWEQIKNEELQEWLVREFLNRLFELRLRGVIVVLASNSSPELGWWPGHLLEMEMGLLGPDDMHTYFVEKWEITPELAQELMKKSGGKPAKMLHLVKIHSPKAKPVQV